MIKTIATSYLLYKDADIDPSQAKQLLVYRYTVRGVNSTPWKLVELFDNQLANASYPYYFNYADKSLYVAIDDCDAPLPTIKSFDGDIITPDNVEYEPRLNPVWLRLLLRKVGVNKGATKGFRSLGKPMIIIDKWGGDNPGIDAMDLDISVKQRSDGESTEVSLGTSNVSLRKLKDGEKHRGKIWCYGRDDWLARWFEGDTTTGALYTEIKKSKNRRKNRSFLNVATAKGLQQSRSFITSQVIDAFTRLASQYGFYLRKEMLTLQKFDSTHRPDKGRRLQTLPLNEHKIYVVDARNNIEIPFHWFVNKFKEMLKNEGLEIELLEFKSVSKDLSLLELPKGQRYLIVLDQSPGLPDDPYQFTNRFSTNAYVQHIIVNPFELIELNIEQWLTRDNFGNVIRVFDDYFDYSESDFQIDEAERALALKLVVAVKELHFKQLMRDDSALLSQYLPKQAEYLKNTALISEGYAVFFNEDRPLVIPFSLTEPRVLASLNLRLSAFDLDAETLINLALDQWPYKYVPVNDFQKDPDKFMKGLTIFLNGKDQMLIQNPGYRKPMLLPDGLNHLLKNVQARENKYLPEDWLINASDSIVKNFSLNVNKVEQKSNSYQQFLEGIPKLVDVWNDLVLSKPMSTKISWKLLRKDFNDRAIPIIGQSSKLRSFWWRFLSFIINRPIYEPRLWLNQIPGLKDLWFDEDKGYYLVGDLNNLNVKIERQPSISQWHALKGDITARVLMPFLDVDFIRLGQFAGRVFPFIFIRFHQEYQKDLIVNN